MSLCGDVVALAAQEEGSALAVVTHAAAPDVATRSQNLQLEVRMRQCLIRSYHPHCPHHPSTPSIHASAC
eukprot:352365-Chlamydomonas_euryale.AAC.3